MNYVILEKATVTVKPHTATIRGKIVQVRQYTRTDPREKSLDEMRDFLFGKVVGELIVGGFKGKAKIESLDDVEKLDIKVADEKMTREKILDAFVINMPEASVNLRVRARIYDEDDLDVWADYHSEYGQVGQNHLYIYNDYNVGGYICSFNLMEIERNYQSQGYGYEFFKRLQNNLKSWGVKQVRLDADLDVGGYAWARYGFDFANDQTKNQTVKNFIRHLGVEWDINEDPNKFNHPWEIAAYKGPHGEPIGKQFLLGESWLATKDLDENSLGWKVGEEYERAKTGTATA